MTTMAELIEMRRKDAVAMYDQVPAEVKNGDLFDALYWAKRTLMEREGTGHQFYLHATKDEMMQCSFAKPEWSGDHCSDSYPDDITAVIMAVCEYLCGM